MEKICTNCENCIIEDIAHEHWVDYHFKCRKNIVHTNHITGDVEYAYCHLYNSNGECENFQKRMGFFERLVNKSKLHQRV